MTLAVDPHALDGAGTTVISTADHVGSVLSTLTGALSGSASMCGNDPAGAAMGRSYDKTAQSLLQAMASARNGLTNIGDGVRVSAHNYSRADASADVSGRSEPLPTPTNTKCRERPIWAERVPTTNGVIRSPVTDSPRPVTMSFPSTLPRTSR